MLTRITFIVWFSFIAIPEAAKEGTLTLRHLETELRQELADLGAIEYHFENGERTLIVAFKTRTFMVHGSSMVGERSREAHEVIGPSYEGFLVRVHLQEQGEINQPVVPQTIREPYWNTDLNAYSLASGEQVYVVTSYGSRLDANIKRRLANFWREPKVVKTQMGEPSPNDLSVLEGTLKLHPKFAYRFYLDGLANGQTCGLRGVDAELKEIQPETRIRVRGILHSHHFEESAYRQPNAALIVADYIYMDVKHVKPLSPGTKD